MTNGVGSKEQPGAGGGGGVEGCHPTRTVDDYQKQGSQ